MPRISLNPNTMFLLAVVLLSAIGVHTIVFHHEHPKFMGDKFEAAMHSEDKKKIVLAVAVIIFAVGSFIKTVFGRIFDAPDSLVGQAYLNGRNLRPHISLLEQFASGILHPRIH